MANGLFAKLPKLCQGEGGREAREDDARMTNAECRAGCRSLRVHTYHTTLYTRNNYLILILILILIIN